MYNILKNAHTGLIKKIFTQHIIKNTNNKNINYFKAMYYFKAILKYVSYFKFG